MQRSAETKADIHRRLCNASELNAILPPAPSRSPFTSPVCRSPQRPNRAAANAVGKGVHCAKTESKNDGGGRVLLARRG